MPCVHDRDAAPCSVLNDISICYDKASPKHRTIAACLTGLPGSLSRGMIAP